MRFNHDLEAELVEAIADRNEAINCVTGMVEHLKKMREMLDSYQKKGYPTTEKLIEEIDYAIKNYSIQIDELKTKPAYLPRRQVSKEDTPSDDADPNYSSIAERGKIVESSTIDNEIGKPKVSMIEKFFAFANKSEKCRLLAAVIIASVVLTIGFGYYALYKCVEHRNMCSCDHPIAHMIELNRTKTKLSSIEIKQLDEIRHQQLERLNKENKIAGENDSTINDTK